MGGFHPPPPPFSRGGGGARRGPPPAAGDADPSDAAPAAAERPVETEIVTPADPAASFVDAEVVDTDIDDRR
ncbi:hypothetical protein [Nocardia farcinica]|uniref:hypothetical protein n=1 Tax=Nocardia farcinica TaxID=37329 RepID=UPI0024549B2B|nr:hypothetical protein [Nocardia farcinica]